MILGVKIEAVVRKDQPLRAAARLAVRVDVAFGVAAARRLREQAFAVAEPVAADGRAVEIVLDAAALPAECAGLVLRDVVVREDAVSVEIEHHVLEVIVVSPFCDGTVARAGIGLRRVRQFGLVRCFLRNSRFAGSRFREDVLRQIDDRFAAAGQAQQQQHREQQRKNARLNVAHRIVSFSFYSIYTYYIRLEIGCQSHFRTEVYP